MKLVAILTSNESRFIPLIEGSKTAKVSIIITNNSESPAIDVAEKHRIPYELVDHKFHDRESNEKEIRKILDRLKLDLVILTGYNRLIKNKDFLKSYHGKMINIHNSFLPDFPGIKPHEDAFKNKAKKSGYTIHLVDREMDAGHVLLQKEVDIADCRSSKEVYDKITEASFEGVLEVINKTIS